jgi:hypothetical protein
MRLIGARASKASDTGRKGGEEEADLAIVGRAVDLRGESPVLAPREMVALEDCLLSEHGAAPAADDLLGRRLRVLHLCGLHQRRQPQFDGLARARAPAAAVVEPVRGSMRWRG